MDKFAPHTIDIEKINAPASKSYAQRILLASALTKQTVNINNIGSCDDVLHIKSIIEQLGAEIIEDGNTLIVTGRVNPILHSLNCGESGLGIRLTTSIASTFGENFTISGKGSLLNRPLTQFEDFLPQMGIDVQLNNGNLPLKISGRIKGGEYTIDGSLSSQYISGLLMALPLAKEDSILHIESPTSLPYIDITLNVLTLFGIKIVNDNYKKYTIKGNQVYSPTQKSINVEGDWSGAAFWVVYGVLNQGISISNLNPNSNQADKAILELLNGLYTWDNDGNLLIESGKLNPFEFDATHCPDLFPILVVLAAGINGKSMIKGVNRLKHKESDRGVVLQSEFNKLGLKIDLNDDIMTIYGTGILKSGKINSNNDHRIAMAGAIAATLTQNGITIQQAESVNKSYPEFWELI